MFDDNEIQNDCFYCLGHADMENEGAPTSMNMLFVATILVALCAIGAVFL